MRPFDYAAPGTLDDALAVIGEKTRPLAGGTDLLTLMKADLYAPESLVALRALLPSGIEEDDGRLTIGAATVLADIEADARVQARHAALAQAAGLAASPQLRNMATIGGNVLQRPRCWYFRESSTRCWLKGGDTCFAREGQNQRHSIFDASPCVAVHPSDPAGALLAFDAELNVRSTDGERRIAMADFFAPPDDARRTENRLDTRELIMSVSLPAPEPGTRSAYLKAMDRGAFSFALVGVAAVVRLSNDRRVNHARVVLTGVAPIPMRAKAAEAKLAGCKPTDAAIGEAAAAALDGAAPLALNAWKVPLARALVKRALGAVTAAP